MVGSRWIKRKALAIIISVTLLYLCFGFLELTEFKKIKIEEVETGSYEEKISQEDVVLPDCNLTIGYSDNSITFVAGVGRLGNQISNLASQFRLWKDYGYQIHLLQSRVNYMEDTLDIVEILKHTDDVKIWNDKCFDHLMKLPWKNLSNSDMLNPGISEPLFRLKQGNYIKLELFINDVVGFYPHMNELRSHIKVKQEYVDYASKILGAIKDHYDCYDGCITVSLHLRCTDYLRHYKSVYGLNHFSTTDYLKNAMAYFQEKFKKIVFYVITDDFHYAYMHLLQKGLLEKYVVTWPSSSEMRYDLALLTLADHSIITHGTFGLWGALLSGHEGKVVHPKGYEKAMEVRMLLEAKVPITYI